MNSTLINRFSAVAIFSWIAGMATGSGFASENVYLVVAGFVAAAVIGWMAAVWETEREENERTARSVSNASVGFLVTDAQWSEERQGFDIDGAETLDLDRRLPPRAG